jgi:beta-phosphoglucomutase
MGFIIPISAIIFDFDGVLFDSEKIHLHACNQVFQNLGFTISENEYFQSYVGLSDNEMFDLILKSKNIQLTSYQVEVSS